jgi:hypothetical protein
MQKSIKTDLDEMLAIEPNLRPSAIALREIFERHFENAELHDDGVESSPIATAPPSLSEKPILTENPRVSGVLQTVSEKWTLILLTLLVIRIPMLAHKPK